MAGAVVVASPVRAGAAATEGAPNAVVEVVVVDGLDLRDAARDGAVGLIVPGWGDTVSRAGAEESLRSGRLSNPRRPRAHDPVIELGPREGATIRISVVLPPDRTVANDRRLPVGITGPGFPPCTKLVSATTRIDGLVSIADLTATAIATAGAGTPDDLHGSRLRSEPLLGTVSDPCDPIELSDLDRELGDVRAARTPVTVGYGIAALVFALLGLWSRRRWPATIAAAALPLAAAASIVGARPLLITDQANILAWQMLLVGLFLVAVLAAISLGRAPSREGLGWFLVVLLVVQAVFAYFLPSWVSLSLLGPNPDTGGRFYGYANELETILVAQTILASALLWPRWGLRAVAALGALGIVTIGAGRLGAAVVGAIVLALGVGVLAVDLARRRAIPLVTLGAAAAAAVLAFAGPEHLANASLGGLGNRIALSAELSVSSVQQGLLTFAAGLVPLLALAITYPRLRSSLDPPIAAALLALLAALAVSLVLNDSPAAVLAHGTLACLGLLALGRAEAQPQPPRRAGAPAEPVS